MNPVAELKSSKIKVCLIRKNNNWHLLRPTISNRANTNFCHRVYAKSSQSSTAVIEILITAKFVANGHEALCDFGNGRVPSDPLKFPILTPAQWAIQAVLTGLLIVQLQGLIAGIPLAARMRPVASYADDFTVVLATQLHQHAAIASAQYTSRLLPFCHGSKNPNRSLDRDTFGARDRGFRYGAPRHPPPGS